MKKWLSLGFLNVTSNPGIILKDYCSLLTRNKPLALLNTSLSHLHFPPTCQHGTLRFSFLRSSLVPGTGSYQKFLNGDLDLSGCAREHLKVMTTCYNGRASCNLRMFLVLLVEGVSLDSGFGFSTNCL